MTISLELRSSNRGAIPVRLTTLEGTVMSIVAQEPAEGAKKNKKAPRTVVLKTAEGKLEFRLTNPSIGISEGHTVRLIYYKAEGFLQKLAGFHNLSKKGSYILNQPKDYFSKWLHVRVSEHTVVPLFAAPVVLCVLVIYFAPLIAAILLIIGLVAAFMVYKNMSKKFVFVPVVHYKSFLLQLMDAFKQCGPEEDD